MQAFRMPLAHAACTTHIRTHAHDMDMDMCIHMDMAEPHAHALVAVQVRRVVLKEQPALKKALQALIDSLDGTG